MLILPIENKIDWRRPPIATLALVILNTVIYFAFLGSDEAALDRAYDFYMERGLLQVEAQAYRRYRAAEDERLLAEGEITSTEPVPEDQESLSYWIFWDLAFDAYLLEHPPESAAPSWRTTRDRFEALRDENSTIGLGLIPAEPTLVTVFTNSYLHGDVWHLFGNMVFLFLFGFSLERSVGWLSYLLLYHLTGLMSSALSILIQPDSYVPTIGASGAVSGLMGAYIAVYQFRRIRFFYSFGVWFGEFRAPALAIFPFWLAKEFYGQFFGDQGIAYWAHIGGLLGGVAAGLGLTLLKRGIDDEYLEESSREAEWQAGIDKLEQLLDEFNYDRARVVAERLLEQRPTDLQVWTAYLNILRRDPDKPDYHKAVLRVIAMAPAATMNPALAEFIEQSYQRYEEAEHPKPVLKSTNALRGLGLLFARTNRLESATSVAEHMLKTKRFDAGLKEYLTALANRLQAADRKPEADRYRKIISRLGASAPT